MTDQTAIRQARTIQGILNKRSVLALILGFQLVRLVEPVRIERLVAV